MGYYLRYICTTTTTLSLKQIENALKQQDSTFKITPDPIDPLIGDLHQGAYHCGEIQLNVPDDDIFEEDIEDLRELVEDSGQSGEQQVMDTLDAAKLIVAVNALWQGGDPSVTLDRLEPLWDWLFANHPGMLQADNEGFYNASGLVFKTNLKI